MNTQGNWLQKEIEKMTPEERLDFDKRVEKMRSEICLLHGDVCECGEDTKRKFWNTTPETKWWNEMKGTYLTQ